MPAVSPRLDKDVGMEQKQTNVDRMLQKLDGLYEKDPARFESLRQDIIAETIRSFPEKFQRRAQGIQFGLDCELNRIKNPVARMNRMVEIFWEKVDEFETVLNDPKQLVGAKSAGQPGAKVIPLFSAGRSEPQGRPTARR